MTSFTKIIPIYMLALILTGCTTDTQETELQIEETTNNSNQTISTSATLSESKLTIPNSQLDHERILTGLTLTTPSQDKSDNGRYRQRWVIRDIDMLEIIGDNQNDADVIAWKCGEYDGSGNNVNPVPLQSFCGKFFIAILKNIVTDPDHLASSLLLETSETKQDAYWISEDISIETDGYFYTIRRTSRM